MAHDNADFLRVANYGDTSLLVSPADRVVSFPTCSCILINQANIHVVDQVCPPARLPRGVDTDEPKGRVICSNCENMPFNNARSHSLSTQSRTSTLQ